MPIAIISAGQSNMVRAESALSAALQLAHPPHTVLIPCAVGGSRVQSWNPGGKCYEAMLLEVGAYMQQGYTIGGIVYNQGEADTHPTGAGAGWCDLHGSMLDALFGEIGYKIPSLHAILGAPPADGILRPNWMSVHNAQILSGARDECDTFGQWDIPRIPNDVHYTAETYAKYHVPRIMSWINRAVTF